MSSLTIFQLDTISLAWATHRLGGIQTPANATYSAFELVHQLKDSGAKCLFTCSTLLNTALDAATQVGIPKNRIYLLEIPQEATGGVPTPRGYKTIDDLIKEGIQQPRLEYLQMKRGDGARKTAFLCYSSGTSGLPVSHGAVSKSDSTANGILERRHDLTPKCHCECPADQSI